MSRNSQLPASKPLCSLLLFVATSTEESELKKASQSLGLRFESDPELKKHLREVGLSESAWRIRPAATAVDCGDEDLVGGERVVAIGCSRERGNVVMGAHGPRGSAAKAMRYRAVTGAQGVVQIGTAFGVSRQDQTLGDVLVSEHLIPYDLRTVQPAEESCWADNFDETPVYRARESLVARFRRASAVRRPATGFRVRFGAVLSGGARIRSSAFRDRLRADVQAAHPGSLVVGGEMEGTGLLVATADIDDPAWCVVKGISDFADENLEADQSAGRETAARNAALFVLASLLTTNPA